MHLINVSNFCFCMRLWIPFFINSTGKTFQKIHIYFLKFKHIEYSFLIFFLLYSATKKLVNNLTIGYQLIIKLEHGKKTSNLNIILFSRTLRVQIQKYVWLFSRAAISRFIIWCKLKKKIRKLVYEHYNKNILNDMMNIIKYINKNRYGRCLFTAKKLISNYLTQILNVDLLYQLWEILS